MMLENFGGGRLSLSVGLRQVCSLKFVGVNHNGCQRYIPGPIFRIVAEQCSSWTGWPNGTYFRLCKSISNDVIGFDVVVLLGEDDETVAADLVRMFNQRIDQITNAVQALVGDNVYAFSVIVKKGAEIGSED